MENALFAYTDESGNSGLHLFDQGQPNFWTGTLLSKIDLEEKKSDILEMANLAEANELHGNELGYGRIEIIASHLSKFIFDNDLTFLFTMVEKEHVARMKIVDTLLDSHINHAVTPLHYGVRALRLSLAYSLGTCVSPRNIKKFWDVYASADKNEFLEIIRNLRWNVENKIRDKRIKELLRDAIDWALTYPDPFLNAKRSNLDSPNIVAFALIMNSLHSIARQKGLRVGRFIHDEQNQFAKYLKEMYVVFKNTSFSMDSLAWITDMESVDTYDGPMEITSSNNNPGLQIVDVVLWIVKRHFENRPARYSPNTESLLKTIIERSDINLFSHSQLKRDVVTNYVEIMSKPFPKEQEEIGLKKMNELENIRKSRMGMLPSSTREV